MKFDYCLQISDHTRVYTTKTEAVKLRKELEKLVPNADIFIIESRFDSYVYSAPDLLNWYYIDYPCGVRGHEVGQKGREFLVSNLVSTYIEHSINKQ